VVQVVVVVMVVGYEWRVVGGGDVSGSGGGGDGTGGAVSALNSHASY
jgi:hypothetical protein